MFTELLLKGAPMQRSKDKRKSWLGFGRRKIFNPERQNFSNETEANLGFCPFSSEHWSNRGTERVLPQSSNTGQGQMIFDDRKERSLNLELWPTAAVPGDLEQGKSSLILTDSLQPCKEWKDPPTVVGSLAFASCSKRAVERPSFPRAKTTL